MGSGWGAPAMLTVWKVGTRTVPAIPLRFCGQGTSRVPASTVHTVAPVMGTSPAPASYRKRYCIGAPGTVGEVAGQNPPSCRQPVKAKCGPPWKNRPE